MAKEYKVKCLRNVGIEGRSYKAGEEAEVDESTAGILVSIGKAALVSGPKVSVQAGKSVSGKRAAE